MLEATSGMRRCELAGARRDLLDLDAGTLTIELTRVVVDGRVIESDGKTENAQHVLALDQQYRTEPVHAQRLRIANALDGLLAANDDGTHYAQYGGLARAGIGTGPNAGINGYYTSLNNPISVQALQFAIGSGSFGNVQPNLSFTTQPIWDTLWLRMLPSQRIMDEDPGTCRSASPR